MKNFALLLIFSFFSLTLHAQQYAQTALEIIKSESSENLNENLISISKRFLGKPYVAGTLEKAPESLVMNLEEFDCFTLVENVLALALTQKSHEPGLDTYREILQLLRYKDGVIEGYGSRNHYFLEWANQAVSNDFLYNLCCTIGDHQEKTINFMSKNRRLYPALVKDNSQLNPIIESENKLSENGFFYVPKEDFKAVESEILDGDIIAFTSNIQGLDVNHEGFAIWQDGKLHLLHASTEEKKVIISKETMEEYLNRIKKHSGIIILRASREF